MVRSFSGYLKTLKLDSKEQKKDKDFMIWGDIMGSIDTDEWINKVTLVGMVSGTFSMKEVYMEDEVMFPCCIWWTGVNAMITDVVNKIKSANEPADRRQRLEKSNFYGDFKKKMIARGIKETSSPDYYKFLNVFQPVISKFINTGTMMTQEEVRIFDLIM